jgi:hypothetical protein
MLEELYAFGAKLLALLLLSFGVAFALTALRRRTQLPDPPPPNARMRIRTPHGVYRSRFLGADERGWAFAAPLCRDRYVPIRPDEPLVIEVTCDGGVQIFRTVLLERCGDTHTMLVRPPDEVHRRDRRDETRAICDPAIPVQVERSGADLLDVSPLGARIACSDRFRPGERVHIRLPWIEEPICGYVLAVEPGERPEIRTRFESPQPLP